MDRSVQDQERLRRDDHALVRSVVSGELEPVPRLTVRLRSVFRILRYLDQRAGGILDDHELADLGQDVVMIIWRKLPEFEGLSSLESWFFRICVLEHRNAVRRKLRQREQSSSLGEREELGDVSAPLAPARDHDDVHEALKRIGREQARIIRLKHFEELTFEEIGRSLGVSPNTAKARYYRGLEELRPLLELREGEDG